MLREGDTRTYSVEHRVAYRLTGDVTSKPGERNRAFQATAEHRVERIADGRATVVVEETRFEVDELGRAVETRSGLRTAYCGVAFPAGPIRVGEKWTEELDAPVGELAGVVIPAERVAPVTLTYRLVSVSGGRARIEYGGSGPVRFSHAADRAEGIFEVSGEADVSPETGRVLLNTERAELTCRLVWGGTQGEVHCVVSSRSAAAD